MRLLKRGDDELKEGRQLEGHAGADVQMASLAFAETANRSGDPLGLLQHVGRGEVQGLTFGGEMHTPRSIDQESGAEELLERLDVERDGRLTQIQVLSRGREAAVVRDRDEYLEPLQTQAREEV